MVKAKIGFLTILLVAAAVSAAAGDFRLQWSKHAIDGSRTGCVSASADNIAEAIGEVRDSVYFAPDGRIFKGGTAPSVAAIVLAAQPVMKDVKQVVGYSPEAMPREYPESGISNLFVDVIMESVEELCDNIALINKSNLIVHGNVEQIRRQYGNNHVELVYKAGNTLENCLGDKAVPFSIVSDMPDRENLHKAVLDVREAESNSRVLKELVDCVEVVSFQELMPRMEDIFIKLVTNNN